MTDHNRASGTTQPSGGDHLDDESLSRLVDGDLAPDTRRAADFHLAACDACRLRLDALGTTVSLLAALPAPRPARSFQLSQAHERAPSGWRRLSAWLLPAMPALRAGAVALVLLLGGVAAFSALRDDDGDDVTLTTTFEETVAPSGADGEVPTLAAIGQAPQPTVTPADAGRGTDGAPSGPLATATPDPSIDDVEMVEITAATEPPPAATRRPAPTEAETDTDEAPAPAGAAGDSAPADVDLEPDERQDGEADAPLAESAPVEPARTAPPEDSAATEDTRAAVPTDEAADVADGAPPAEDADTDEESDAASSSAAPSDAGQETDDVASDSAAAGETAFTADTPTPSPAATITPTPRPTTLPAAARQGDASPAASPAASPVGSPAAEAITSLLLLDDVSVDTLSPRRLDLMGLMAILVATGALAVVVRALRASPR